MYNMAHSEPHDHQETHRELLLGATFDMNSIETFEDALSNVPEGERVAVTLAPPNGIWPTIERTEYAAERGYEVIPHLGARFITDYDELEDILTRLSAAGVTDVFVIGGDRDEPVGQFESAYDLLLAIDELGYEFEEVGIGGYPTGHKEIAQEALIEAMTKKSEYATYIVTQLCFDATAIITWLEGVRDSGIDLPVVIGIPGKMQYWELMKLSQLWGIAKPLDFLRKTTGITGFLRELLFARGTYEPGDLLAELVPYAERPEYNIRGIRFYTFNQTDTVVSWQRQQLREL